MSTDDMHLMKPRFDPTFNYGHILTAVTIFFGGIGALLYVVQWQAKTDDRLDRLYSTRPGIEDAINKLTSSQLVQDEQIRNLAALARDGQKRSSEIATRLDSMQNDLTVIKARTKME